MTAVDHYSTRDVEAPSVIPDAARGIVEWAQSADAAYALAQRLVDTTFSPAQYRGKPADAAAAILSGAEVGLSPMASLRAFDIIQGVAAPRALTVRAIVLSRGHDMVVDESTPARCRMRGRRKGTAEWQAVEWTIQRAAALGLTGKQQWKAQPQAMLVARCTTELGRLIAADALLGLPYSLEELADAEPEASTPVARQAPVARVARAPRPRAVTPAPEPPLDDELVDQARAQEPPAPDEPTERTAPAEERGDGLTDRQMRQLLVLFNEAGVTDRDARLDRLSAVVGRDVLSSKDLTRGEASRAIDAMKATAAPVDVDEPPLDGWGQ